MSFLFIIISNTSNTFHLSKNLMIMMSSTISKPQQENCKKNAFNLYFDSCGKYQGLIVLLSINVSSYLTNPPHKFELIDTLKDVINILTKIISLMFCVSILSSFRFHHVSLSHKPPTHPTLHHSSPCELLFRSSPNYFKFCVSTHGFTCKTQIYLNLTINPMSYLITSSIKVFFFASILPHPKSIFTIASFHFHATFLKK